MPSPVKDARQVVLLALDGLGWEQLQAFADDCPTLARMAGAAITTVAPTTTATALTSLATGLTPGEHGIMGYRMPVQGELLQVLRWGTDAGDARKRIRPQSAQRIPAFFGASVPAIAKEEFAESGFTQAHLQGVRYLGWKFSSTLVGHVVKEIAANEPFIYAYYDGIDKVAHRYGLSDFYRLELQAADRLVSDLLQRIPSDAVLLVTADHGHVEVDEIITLDPSVRQLTRLQSGEGRFRWLHANWGSAGDLWVAAKKAHGDVAWIMSQGALIEGGWFGPNVTDAARSRLGDVALIPFRPVSFEDPAEHTPVQLLSRHGSLTSAELLVPLLAARGLG
jgi:hypothetical protein